MQDRFKFRVWDLKEREYRTRSINCLADDLLDIFTGRMQYGDGNEIYGDVNEDYLIIEQCTGLKDKNGNLIYEGDIVKFRNDLPQGGTNKTDDDLIGLVNYLDELGCFCFDTFKTEKERNRVRWFGMSFMWAIETAVVIGNIHENSALFEV